MNEGLLWDLMLWAAMLSQHPMPDALPDIEPVPRAFLVEHFCASEHCQIAAMYVPESNDEIAGRTVYIEDDYYPVDNVEEASILVHEFVHYLQDQGGAMGSHISCEQWWDNERHAYRAQSIYLRKNHSPMAIDHRVINFYECTPDG